MRVVTDWRAHGLVILHNCLLLFSVHEVFIYDNISLQHGETIKYPVDPIRFDSVYVLHSSYGS